MIPIRLSEAHKALTDKKINMWEIMFLDGVHKEETLTEKQYDKILLIAQKMLPYKLIEVADIPHNEYQQKIDPYFNDTYFKE